MLTRSLLKPSEHTIRRRAVARRRQQILRRRTAAVGLLALIVLAVSVAIAESGGGSAARRVPVPRADRLPAMADREQRDQIGSQAEWLARRGVPRPRLFRPPCGSFDASTFSLLRGERMLMVLWCVDSWDYRQPGAKVIVRRVVHGAKPGAIVLMHD